MRALLGISSGLAVALCTQGGEAYEATNPCERKTESNMMVDAQRYFGFDSVLVVEDYLQLGNPEKWPPPVDELVGFYGVRVTECTTGRFVAIPTHEGAFTVEAALLATEFLRPAAKKKSPISFDGVLLAANAVYGDVMVMNDNEETCACRWLHPDVRPKGMLRFEKRQDVGQFDKR